MLGVMGARRGDWWCWSGRGCKKISWVCFGAFLWRDGRCAVDDAGTRWGARGGMVPKMGDGRWSGVWIGVWIVAWDGVAGGFCVFCKDTERCYLFVVVHIA